MPEVFWTSPELAILSAILTIYGSWRLRRELRRLANKIDRIWDKLNTPR